MIGSNWTKHKESNYQYECNECSSQYHSEYSKTYKRSEELYTERDIHLHKKYGIRERDYEALLKSQGGGCAICGIEKDPNGMKMAVDHDHSKDYMDIRGILCSKCNQGIGLMSDNIQTLSNAINYLGGTA